MILETKDELEVSTRCFGARASEVLKRLDASADEKAVKQFGMLALFQDRR
jgi:hypothetical protein